MRFCTRKFLFTGVIAVLILKARPLGELRREAVRGHKCVSKVLSSPGVRGFNLVYFTPINSRLSSELQRLVEALEVTFDFCGDSHPLQDFMKLHFQLGFGGITDKMETEQISE